MIYDKEGMIMKMTLTKELLEEHIKDYKEGEISLGELKAGLVAIYGGTPMGEMTVEEARKYTKLVFGVELKEL